MPTQSTLPPTSRNSHTHGRRNQGKNFVGWRIALGRNVRTRLNLLRPSVSDRVSCSQAKQKKYHDVHVRLRDFFVGQRVYARNYRGGSKWVPGTLVARCGSLSFVVQVNDGVQWHCHVDQLVESPDSPQDCSSFSVLDVPDHDFGCAISIC